MGILSKAKRLIKDSKMGREYAEKQEEKKWKEGIQKQAKSQARAKAEEALMKKYENEEVDRIVAGKKKSGFLEKLNAGFGNQSAGDKVSKMLGTSSEKVGTIEKGQKQPKSMSEKILGDGSEKGMFNQDKIDRMLGSDNKVKDKIKKTTKKHVPEKEYSFSKQLDKML